jgi:hypothetical protein
MLEDSPYGLPWVEGRVPAVLDFGSSIPWEVLDFIRFPIMLTFEKLCISVFD